MTEKFAAEVLYQKGYTPLVCVIPPGAALAPSSRISGSSLGKVPGVRRASGLWTGYDWRQHMPSIDDIRQWSRDGANFGLLASNFPAVDIDCLEPGLAKIIEDVARAQLGPAPVRYGLRPKRLLIYSTLDPFTRMRLGIEQGDARHIVEVLGLGQQYLVQGMHPKTLMPYEWMPELPPAESLTRITLEQVQNFLRVLGELIDVMDMGKVTREGTGRPALRATPEQAGLLAPSIDDLRMAVMRIPNTNATHPDRESYIKMGYAIRAACGVQEHDGYEIFADWSARWAGNAKNPNGNDKEVVLYDWRRMLPPYVVGWSFIAETARAYGFNAAGTEFGAASDTEQTREDPSAPPGSDQWLAAQVVARHTHELRYVPSRGQWLVWNGARWVPDADLLADDIIKRELRRIGDDVARTGATTKEKKESLTLATSICSAYRVSAVRQLVQSDRAIALTPDVLDYDPWALCTPAGIVDLKTGGISASDPDKLCTRSTLVAPDFHTEPREWLRFLDEATGGDGDLQGYLQRLAGYGLTGSTREQHFTFIHGAGGNGKGTFLHAIEEIMNDYYKQADMRTFTANKNDEHSTELAGLAGARLVTSSEVEAGKRWNEQRITLLTGGDRIRARFMRQDFFTFLPQFKLIFTGNYRPEIRNITPALRRRTHLVPFDHTPQVVDGDLGDKLRAEYPAILAWMIRGCLQWQEDGLNPPQVVRDTTADYFREEDVLGKWLAECTQDSGETTTYELFGSWQEWANRNGEYVGSMRRFSSALASRGLPKWRHPENRRHGFRGISVRATGGVLAV